MAKNLRITVWLSVFFLILVSSAGSVFAAEAPTVTADSAIVIEAMTGRVVYEKNADEVRPPASMTKIMTCILGLEKMRPHTLITIGPVAAQTEDVMFGWNPSDQMEAQELLRGMMLVSENGAAVAAAQQMAGTLPLFARMMNEKAAEIGCTHTQFSNPNGLPNSAHYSTARDMAKIAAYGMKNPEFRKIVAEKEGIVRWASPKGRYVEAENTNQLLKTYDGATGLKTGWTNAAGGCLAASAKRNGVELIAIVMHADDTQTRFEDARKLLDYGFTQVTMHKGINKDRVSKSVWVRGGTSARVHVGPAEDVNYPLLQGEKATHYSVAYDVPFIIDGGVKKGQKVGEMVLKYDEEIVARIPVVAHEDVAKGFSISSSLIGFVAGLMSMG